MKARLPLVEWKGMRRSGGVTIELPQLLYFGMYPIYFNHKLAFYNTDDL